MVFITSESPSIGVSLSALLTYLGLFLGDNLALAFLARAFKIWLPFLRRFICIISIYQDLYNITLEQRTKLYNALFRYFAVN